LTRTAHVALNSAPQRLCGEERKPTKKPQRARRRKAATNNDSTQRAEAAEGNSGRWALGEPQRTRLARPRSAASSPVLLPPLVPYTAASVPSSASSEVHREKR
jgi:hypothetical protein